MSAPIPQRGTFSTNFGAAAEDYAKYRAGFPASFFDRLAALGLCQRGTGVVDLGTGTGTLARGFALRGASVTGIDPDERLTREAAALDQLANVTVKYRRGTAEHIPVSDSLADIVSAGQCWHWFDAEAAAREISRILKPEGHVVIAHLDWLPYPGNVVEATERLIQRFNSEWDGGGGDGFHPESIPALYAAGFRRFEAFSYDVENQYSPEAWRGRIRASAGVGATLSDDKILEFDSELARLLEMSFSEDPISVPHRVFCLIATRR
jgi:SAM-dependent methyltransferase